MKAKKLQMPPIETRSKTLASFGGNLDFFGGRKFAESEVRALTKNSFVFTDWLLFGMATQVDLRRIENGLENVTLVILSDIYLDCPNVLHRLRTLFKVYATNDDVPTPLAFVFIGNFTSTPYVCNGAFASKYKDSWGELADILSQFPKLIKQSMFVFIPGPGDPTLNGGGGAGGGSGGGSSGARTGGGGSLPRAKVPDFFREKLRRVLGDRGVWGTNPCRLKYCTKEIVIFREDLLGKMRRNSIIGPNNDKEMDPRKHVCL